MLALRPMRSGRRHVTAPGRRASRSRPRVTGRGLLPWHGSATAIVEQLRDVGDAGGLEAGRDADVALQIARATGRNPAARRGRPRHGRRRLPEARHALARTASRLNSRQASSISALARPWCSVVHRRERVGAGVGDAEPLLERDGAHHRGHQHAAAGLEVLAVLDGGLQVLGDQADALERDAVADRVEALGDR